MHPGLTHQPQSGGPRDGSVEFFNQEGGIIESSSFILAPPEEGADCLFQPHLPEQATPNERDPNPAFGEALATRTTVKQVINPKNEASTFETERGNASAIGAKNAAG